MSNNDSNSPMNVVEVNLNNKGNNIQTINSNIDYHEINTYNYNLNKDTDNSGDGLSNNQEEAEEEKEQEQEEEELSMAEIAHLKKYMNRQCYVLKNTQIYILLKIPPKSNLHPLKMIPKKK